MTKFKADISKEDRQYLVDHGFREGQPHTIPENISPAIKSQLLKEMGEPDWGDIPGIPGTGNEDKVKGPNPGTQADAATGTDDAKPARKAKDA